MIALRVLGTVEVRTGQDHRADVVSVQPKRLALLLYLALAEPMGFHARDRLLRLLWPEADDASARHSLRNALHALRNALGDGAIVTRGEAWIGLDARELQCDALELRRHLASGRTEQALALWTGELAPGFHVADAPDFERWLDDQRAALHRTVLAGAWKQADACRGETESELNAVRLAFQLDPGDEQGARRLMRLLADSGNRANALRVFEELSRHLARELEVEPSAETRALADELRPPGTAAHERARSATPHHVAGPLSDADAPTRRDVRTGRRPRLRGVVVAGLLVCAALSAVAYQRSRTTATASEQPGDSPEAEATRAVLRLPAHYRADTGLYGSYLRGLALRFGFRFRESRDTLTALVDRAPLYVPGIYGLGHTLALTALSDLSDRDLTWPRVELLARRALALDSTAASAWLLLAARDMHALRDFERAGERLLRARALDAHDPDMPAMRSVWFRYLGQMDSAVVEAKLAHEIDPLSVYFARALGKQLYFARRYQEAAALYGRLLRDDPAWVRVYPDVAHLYLAMGQPREAAKWFARVREAEGDSAAAAALSEASSGTDARRRIADDARRTLARLDSLTRAGQRPSPSRYAMAYAMLHDTTRALQWLDSLVAQHIYVSQVRVDPTFDFLRSDPRYAAWDARCGLPRVPTSLTTALR